MRTLLFLFYTFSLSAQISGTLVNEKDEPIPYVNIWVQDENIGTTSDEKGIFKINTNSEKTLVFSAVGFEIKKTSIQDNEKVILKEAIYKLDEVTVTKRKQDKEFEIGGAEKIHHKQFSGDKPWVYAKLFEYDSIYKATPYLKKIVFFSDSEKKGAKLKIRIFQFNNSIPTIDLLDEDLIVTVKKGMRKNEIDISKYNLRFPKNGIVIGLEWMIIEENKFVFEYTTSMTKKKSKEKSYAPSLIVNYSKVENSFNYSEGKWSRGKIFTTDKNDKPWYNTVMMPAIKLILTN
jgi:hypothetical protein